ncbi:hypothetical protein P692DRAFT_20851203 [Suillus brevipes Sb2]|nr:hypothetical protein P692DRAFT_20851203 [Suillus brevipes Sb2]
MATHLTHGMTHDPQYPWVVGMGIWWVRVRVIFNPLAPSETADEMQLAQKSMVALATTCRTFHEPAMDFLWTDLDGIEPLLGCVTRLHAVIYPIGTKVGSDWLFHSSAWSLQDITPLNEQEASLFLHHAVHTCVFPKLQSLHWKTSTNRYLNLFLSPTLRRCSIPVIDSGLTRITTHCAALKDLFVMSFSRTTGYERSLLSDSVHLCTQLENLCCPELDWEAWRHLSTLSTLQNLAVYDWFSATHSAWSLKPDLENLSPFLNVKSLSFVIEGAGCIIAIMKHSVFPSLEKFSGFSGVMSSAEAEQLLCALSQCKACQTMECIIIQLSSGRPLDLPGSTLTPTMQLLCFAQLQTLTLHLPDSSIYIDDDLLFKAASSWPHIRILQIEGPYHNSAAITFHGLFAAFRHCPHLHTLQFLIDSVNIDVDILDLTATSLIADAKAVACIICLRHLASAQELKPCNWWDA